jgi:hypothetical protein
VRGAAVVLTAALAITWSPVALVAQEEGAPPPDSAAAGRGSTFVPLPVVFYQPETKLGFGVLLNYYFRASEPEPGRRDLPSTLSAIGVYTVNKQIIATLGTELYLDGGRTRLLGGGGFIKFPTKFWGIGNDSEESDSTNYTPQTLNFTGEVQRELLRGWYLGAAVQVAYREIISVEGEIDLDTVPGAEDGWVVGPGALVTWDTRDNTIWPRRGGYHLFRAFIFDDFFGSSFDYGSYLLDLRGYFPLLSRQVVALRAVGMASSGTPPFDLLPQLGGDALLRGYFQGRFRDRQLMAFQGEFRTPVWWRFGAVGFASVGQVADVWGDMGFDRFKLAAGGGIRFEISRQEGLNLRADYGWGFDVGSGGFYLSIGEAF